MAKLESWTYDGGKATAEVTTAIVVETAEEKAARWARQDYTVAELEQKRVDYAAWIRACGLVDGGFGDGELGL